MQNGLVLHERWSRVDHSTLKADRNSFRDNEITHHTRIPLFHLSPRITRSPRDPNAPSNCSTNNNYFEWEIPMH